MLGHWDKEKAEIGVIHLKKWLPFCFNKHCHVKTDITGFLIHDKTSLVTKIMILRQLDAEIAWGEKLLAGILKNGRHFVYRTNLRWPYIKKCLFGHTLSLCQISNLYQKVHDSSTSHSR